MSDVKYGSENECLFCSMSAYAIQSVSFNENININFCTHDVCYEGQKLPIKLSTLNKYLKLYSKINGSCIFCDKKQETQQVTFRFPNSCFSMLIGQKCDCRKIFYHYFSIIDSQHQPLTINCNTIVNADLLLNNTSENLEFFVGNIEREIHEAILISRAEGLERWQAKHNSKSNNHQHTEELMTMTVTKELPKNQYIINREKQILEAMMELSKPYFVRKA